MVGKLTCPLIQRFVDRARLACRDQCVKEQKARSNYDRHLLGGLHIVWFIRKDKKNLKSKILC